MKCSQRVEVAVTCRRVAGLSVRLAGGGQYDERNPAEDAPVTRTFERALTNVRAVNPYSGSPEKVATFVADQIEMRLLHMVTADPARTPTVTLFAKPNYFLFAGAPNCNSPCTSINPNFNWNHGDVAPGIRGRLVRHQ